MRLIMLGLIVTMAWAIPSDNHYFKQITFTRTEPQDFYFEPLIEAKILSEELEDPNPWNDSDLEQKIIMIESRGDSKAVSSDGSVGLHQIRPECVEDLNRITGGNTWHLKDRLDPVQSHNMYKEYMKYYGLRYLSIMKRLPDKYALACIWNGGPDGFMKVNAMGYAHRILDNKNNGI